MLTHDIRDVEMLNELLQYSQLFHCPLQPLSVSLSCLSSENNLHSVAERTRRCLGWIEEKQRGGGVEREMLQLWGDKTTEQHLTCGLEEGGHEACGGCTQWHCYKGVGGGGTQLIRFGEMDHSLRSSPWEALTQNTPASVWFFKLEESKKPKKKKEEEAVNQRVHKWFYTPGENKYWILGAWIRFKWNLGFRGDITVWWHVLLGAARSNVKVSSAHFQMFFISAVWRAQ